MAASDIVREKSKWRRDVENGTIGGGGGGGSPAAPFDSVQFNNAGSFGGEAEFTFDGTTLFLDTLHKFNINSQAADENGLNLGDGSVLVGNQNGNHVAIDRLGIQQKSNGTTAGTLNINNFGGDVNFGNGIALTGMFINTPSLSVGGLNFDTTQNPGASEDDWVLTYDFSTDRIRLAAPSGGGISGSISNDQVAVGTGTDTIGGTPDFTFESSNGQLFIRGINPLIRLRDEDTTEANAVAWIEGEGQEFSDIWRIGKWEFSSTYRFKIEANSNDAIGVRSDGTVDFFVGTNLTSISSLGTDDIDLAPGAISSILLSGTDRSATFSDDIILANGQSIKWTSAPDTTIAGDASSGIITLATSGSARLSANDSFVQMFNDVRIGNPTGIIMTGAGYIERYENSTAFSDGDVLAWSTANTRFEVQAQSTSNLVDDTSPQLGGDLDVNTFDIVGDPDIRLTPQAGVGGTSGSQTVDYNPDFFFIGAPTGLNNDATVYTANISVDGGANQLMSVVGSTAQQVAGVLASLNGQLVGATAGLTGGVNGDIIITSSSTGASSTISITDIDLFSSINNFSSILSPVNGTAGSSNGGIVIANAGAPTVTTDQLYNDGGNLFWNGVQLDAGSGAWALISTVAPSGETNIDLTFDESLYSAIRIELDGIQPGTDAVTFRAQLGDTNGTVIYNTTNDYDGVQQVWEGTAGYSALAASDRLDLAASASNAANETISGTIELKGFRGSDLGAFVHAQLYYRNSVSNQRMIETKAFLDDNVQAAIDTVRLFFASGVFASTGNIRVYGLRV